MTNKIPGFAAMVKTVTALKNPPKHLSGLTRYVDMFCGIGGFHYAASSFGMECVFACDIDSEARKAYEHNFGIQPANDISRIKAEDVPDHDLFLAGFPCQPFSIIGSRKGFADIRGTLFFEIARILRVKKPKAVLLENVKQLTSDDGGKTIKRIVAELEDIGYCVSWKVLNALELGLPQKRERVLIAATLEPFDVFPWPSQTVPMKPLNEVLEKNPNKSHFVSERILKRRQQAHESEFKPGIWHENKGGDISSHPFSCALRAGASYNYLLVDGKRRLTPREMLRLQGFPESFEIVCNDSQTRKQAGNAVPVPLVTVGIQGIINVLKASKIARKSRRA
jgi:DNA (cytosine-5)-methyltransferase 1